MHYNYWEMEAIVKFHKIREGVSLPRKVHASDAGFDLESAVGLRLEPGEWALVATGLQIEMPAGMEAQVRPRSGLALKHGVTVLNAPGTIDSGYRGEVGVVLINHGGEVFLVEPGMRVAQLVFAKVMDVRIAEAEALDTTARGGGGFGSSGV